MDNTVTAETIITALKSRAWSTAELVRIAHAVGQLGHNTTSILGQYGEELVAEAFGGAVASFDQKAFDVRTPNHGDLQVKTYSVGKSPGAIRSFTHDVVTVQVNPATARVVSAKFYAAADLFERFQMKFTTKYASAGQLWGGGQSDRFERGWRIESGVTFTDVTHLFHVKAAE